jgi:hypothetical protein
MQPERPDTFEIDASRPLIDAGGGLDAFAATGPRGRSGLMAQLVRLNRPPRARTIAALIVEPVDGMLCPVHHGVARFGPDRTVQAVWSVAPAGPSLATIGAGVASGTAWSESMLMGRILRPAARALAHLDRLGLTHRGIRPDNIFLGPDGVAVLGAAWAAPSGSLQSVLHEPPSVAMCLPCGRGDGTVADDVYALGVVLLGLALGRPPMLGFDDEAIIRRKLAFGSPAALIGDARLSPSLAELLRAMLCDDPARRPLPARLLEPTQAAQQVPARPPRRAKSALIVGDRPVLDLCSLAYALARQPAAAERVLRSGAVSGWLRREYGDPALAARIDERAADYRPGLRLDPTLAGRFLVMTAVSLLDPLMPPCWGQAIVWKDGLGPAIAAATGVERDDLLALVDEEALSTWQAIRPERDDAPIPRAEWRQHRAWLRKPGLAGGVQRLRFGANKLLACDAGDAAPGQLPSTPMVALSDVLPALEEVAGRVVDKTAFEPLAGARAAFVAARAEGVLDDVLAPLARGGGSPDAAVTLRVLARLQSAQHPAAQHPAPLPSLGAVMMHRVDRLVAPFRDALRREALRTALAAEAEAGRLDQMERIISDPLALAADHEEARAAESRIAAIDRRLAALAASRGRVASAAWIGREAPSILGLLALAAALIAAALIAAAVG